ncbi:hypothetical protein SCANM63S_08840 [Streptomyces canarius]
MRSPVRASDPASPVPNRLPAQQSCAGASNDDHRSASGHRGRLGPLRLCDGAGRGAAGQRALAADGDPAGRQRGAPCGAGTGPRGTGEDGPVRAPGALRTARPAPGPGRTRGHPPPAGPTRAPAPGSLPPTAHPRAPPTPGGDPSSGCLRPGQDVRRLAEGQPPSPDLRTGVRPLTAALKTVNSQALGPVVGSNPATRSGAVEPSRAGPGACSRKAKEGADAMAEHGGVGNRRQRGRCACQAPRRRDDPNDRAYPWRGGLQPSSPGVPSSPSRRARRLISDRTPAP